MTQQEKKLGVIPLAALVVSAMIGGGIFSLPQNMAQGASVSAVILAWIITGIGMFFIASTFRILSNARPDATTGIYAYAKLGFGRFAGFQMAWAYWLSNIFGNVAFAVLLMDALNYFFPGYFRDGNNLASIIGGSIVIWGMNFAVLRGVKQAAAMNTLGTICKLLPIVFFIIVMLFGFRWAVFTFDPWGNLLLPEAGIKPLGGLLPQVKSTMLVTLWAFIGIEGAVVISGRAKSPNDVGKATLLGFLCCLIIYALLSILPFGRMHQSQLEALSNPSTAPLLADVLHANWGSWIMNLGVIIALLTSWLAFTIMIAQIPYAAAQDGAFPQIFRRENRNESPSVSLWVSSILMQICMIVVYFEHNAWDTMLSVTSVMILPPYLACTAYLWKMCAKGEYPENMPVGRHLACFYGAAGTLYGLWMIYAAGLTYMLMAFVILMLGIPVYLYARVEYREHSTDEKAQAQPLMTGAETAAAVLIVLIALMAIILFASKKVTL